MFLTPMGVVFIGMMIRMNPSVKFHLIERMLDCISFHYKIEARKMNQKIFFIVSSIR